MDSQPVPLPAAPLPDLSFTGPLRSWEVPCTHCGHPAFHGGYEAGERTQLCPDCELIVEYQHACPRCRARNLAYRCAARGDA